MWVYRVVTGELTHTQDPQFEARGYSGAKPHVNDQRAEGLEDYGPIPRGYWSIGAPRDVQTPGKHGPFVLPLTPDAHTETLGRSGFLIHGDSIEHPGAASEGCIILDRATRERIAASGDPLLVVT